MLQNIIHNRYLVLNGSHPADTTLFYNDAARRRLKSLAMRFCGTLAGGPYSWDGPDQRWYRWCELSRYVPDYDDVVVVCELLQNDANGRGCHA